MLAPVFPLLADDEAERALHPRALNPAIQAFYRNVVCTKCKGDGSLTYSVKKIKKGKKFDKLYTVKEEKTCQRCEGSGTEELRDRVETSAERFVMTLEQVDLDHQQAKSRLDSAKDKLERMQCILESQNEGHFNDWTLRALNQTTITLESAIVINGVYIIKSHSDSRGVDRVVEVHGSNFIFLFEDIRIHDAKDDQRVFAGGVLSEVRPKRNGRLVIVIRDGFVVRADPDCPQN